MNIFVLDKDPVAAAQMHCDKHCVKMILETAQILSTAIRLTDGGDFGYKATHKNHPCSVWARQTKGNFNWLKSLGLALCSEYTYRYGKTHKSASIIATAMPGSIPDGDMTPFVQAMPDDCKREHTIEAYRSYYKSYKQRMLVYTRRRPPKWLGDLAKYKMTEEQVLELIEEVINAEEEFPGEMPDEMYNTLINLDKEAMTEAMRMSVILTKRGIMERVKEKLKPL